VRTSWFRLQRAYLEWINGQAFAQRSGKTSFEGCCIGHEKKGSSMEPAVKIPNHLYVGL
tara:strand:- start:410 stop:586 length:177 start_codon:yes stop_codon:yes gene_type:complete